MSGWRFLDAPHPGELARTLEASGPRTTPDLLEQCTGVEYGIAWSDDRLPQPGGTQTFVSAAEARIARDWWTAYWANGGHDHTVRGEIVVREVGPWRKADT